MLKELCVETPAPRHTIDTRRSVLSRSQSPVVQTFLGPHVFNAHIVVVSRADIFTRSAAPQCLPLRRSPLCMTSPVRPNDYFWRVRSVSWRTTPAALDVNSLLIVLGRAPSPIAGIVVMEYLPPPFVFLIRDEIPGGRTTHTHSQMAWAC